MDGGASFKIETLSSKWPFPPLSDRHILPSLLRYRLLIWLRRMCSRFHARRPYTGNAFFEGGGDDSANPLSRNERVRTVGRVRYVVQRTIEEFTSIELLYTHCLLLAVSTAQQEQTKFDGLRRGLAEG